MKMQGDLLQITLLLIFKLVVGLEETLDGEEDQPTDYSFLDESIRDKFKLFLDNPEETENGEKIIEGDIVVPNNTEYQDMFRKSTFNLISLWPFGRVSYNFHYSVNDRTKTIIREALQEWEEHTCLKFYEKVVDWYYLRFRSDTSGCWSLIGHTLVPFEGQDISIGRGCETKGVVIHEVGHAIGLYHEQSRSDRAKHIKILWENIQLGKHSQFSWTLDLNYGVEYDLSSIMHYSPMAFSRKVFEKNTIVSKNPHFQRLMGRKGGLSFNDKKLANRVYLCDFLCPNKKELNCKNGGYISPYRNDDKPCHCVCPPHTTGERCDEILNYYYDSPPCGGNITEEITFQTPNYPSRKPYESCSWWIQAPFRKKVQVEFEDFSFIPRLNRGNNKYNGLCASERVEIRTHDLYRGKMYCGTDLAPGTKMTSKSKDFIIIIEATSWTQGKGLKAKVNFV